MPSVKFCSDTSDFYFHTFSHVHFGQIQYFFKVLKINFEIQYFFYCVGTLVRRWAESHFSDSNSVPASSFKIPSPTPKNFVTLNPTLVKCFQVTHIKHRKDSVYFTSWSKIYVVAVLPFSFIEHKWLKWSCDKHNKNTERHNVLMFKSWLKPIPYATTVTNQDKKPRKICQHLN